MTSNQTELSAARWRKSSHSNSHGGDCVEVAGGPTSTVPVRDSKHPEGPVVTFGASAWSAFIDLIAQGG